MAPRALEHPRRSPSDLATASATRRVANNVVKLREARGLTQEALAQKTGLNRVTLARLERAQHPPNLETLDRIARALHVSLAELVG